MQVLRVVRDLERVRLDRGRQLVARAHHDLRVDAEPLPRSPPQAASPARRRRGAAGEDDVAALHRRLDVACGRAPRSARAARASHPLARADVDAAQQRDPVRAHSRTPARRCRRGTGSRVSSSMRRRVRCSSACCGAIIGWLEPNMTLRRRSGCAGRRRAPADSAARCRRTCRCRRSRACGRRRPSPPSTGTRCARTTMVSSGKSIAAWSM